MDSPVREGAYPGFPQGRGAQFGLSLPSGGVGPQDCCGLAASEGVRQPLIG